MIRLKNILVIIFLSSLAACSVTKQIPPGDALYIGSKVKLKPVNDSTGKFAKKDLSEELESLVRPAPNKKILGIRFKLMVFNAIDTPKKNSGIKYWLKYKVGEPPVLASTVNIEKNRTIMENRLENRGYFRSSVTADTVIKKKKMEAYYTGAVQKRYLIRNVKYPGDSGAIYRIIRHQYKKTPLKKGKPYNLDVLLNERNRIDARLKENGFYYFKPDDIIFDVDSTIGNHRIDIFLKLKKETPFRDLVNYRINDVIVYADYDINSDTTGAVIDTVPKYRGYRIIDPEEKFNPKIFPQTLVFKPGGYYKRSDHSTSLNRLVSLGVYKFVKVRFDEVDTINRPMLNAFYYLTPLPKKSLSLEISGLTKSNNATGTEVSINWKNRNFLRGAELLTARVYGGFEKQVSSIQRVNTLTAGAEANLIVPRVIGPFHIKNSNSFVPQTIATVGYDYFSRDTQYTLTSSRLSLGYVWKRSIKNEHDWKFLSFNYVQPTNIAVNYQKMLDTNITLARSIEKQFILGMIYNYNYNSQAAPNRKRHNFYFNGNADISGNVAGLLTGANVKDGKEKIVFGTPFSQYIRAEADFRHYLRLGKNNMLASRFFAGAGYAYGNSVTMPFVKEFFAGGVNSIRAFRARGLGPGSFYAGNPKETYVPDQPGDIRLEMNTELRAKLVSLLYGAIFVDAGNVWLFKEDTSRPGGKFTNKFLSQVAVGTGIGLRVDVKFFVLRADLAFPIRKPYLADGSRWVFGDINFGDAQWRKDNLILNIAIGYPF